MSKANDIFIVFVLFRVGLFLFFFVILVDVEIFELITTLGVGNNTKPITKVVCLEIFLRQVFEVTFGEVNLGLDADFGLAGDADTHVFAEVSSFAFDLDVIFEEFLELGNLHDAIFDWMSTINLK
jgi:hypothetical protein